MQHEMFAEPYDVFIENQLCDEPFLTAEQAEEGLSILRRLEMFLLGADIADGELPALTLLTSYEAHGARQIVAQCEQGLRDHLKVLRKLAAVKVAA